jgi:transcriptional regulator with XRE-family HTH domain
MPTGKKVSALPPAKAPSARARQLAAELRRLREAMGLTGEEVASRLNWSASKVSRIETSRTAVTASDLRTLLDLYQITGSTRDRLAELGRTANQRGWWDAYGETLSYGYSTFLALENDAESERFYGQMLVPGILQTRAYAEEIMRASLLATPPGEVARRVDARMTRQHLLAKEEPLRLTTILDESVLRRQVGGPGIMASQIAHLIEMAALPHLTLQIMPFSRGAHIAMTGSFSLLRFPGPTASYVVYLENMTGELFIESEIESYHYALAFDRLAEFSLSPEESVDFAAQLAREIK